MLRFYSFFLALSLVATCAVCHESRNDMLVNQSKNDNVLNSVHYEFVDFSHIDFNAIEFVAKKKEDFKAIDVVKEGEPVKCPPPKPVGFESFMSHGYIDCTKERVEKQEKICMYELHDVFYIDQLHCFVGFLNEKTMYLLGSDPTSVKNFLARLRKKSFMLVIDNGVVPDFFWYRNQYHDLVGWFGFSHLCKDLNDENRTILGLTRFVKEFSILTEINNIVDYDDIKESVPIVKFKKVLIQNHICHYQPALINKTREILLPHFEKKKEKDRIYISRSDAQYRKVSNEDKLQECLKKYGFKIVTLNGMNLSEQIELFANAEIVVGPHGAGLANILFCDPGTKVVELFSKDMRNFCMLNIAEIVGLDYWYLADQPSAEPSPQRNALTYNANYNVDIDLLEKWLQVNAK